MAVIVTYTIIAYYVAYVAKVGGVKKKWLPAIAATTGMICGVVSYFCGILNTDFLDALGLGLFSGFSATGTNEIAKYIFVRKE